MRNFLLAIVLVAALVYKESSVFAAKIELFGREDFQDLLHVAGSADKCTDIPKHLEDKVTGSVKTDVCLSLYKGTNCTAGILWTGPGSLRQLAFYVEGNHRVEYPVNSFKACNGTSGGQPIDLDIYGKENTQGPVVLEIRGLTGCMNLPNSLTGLNLSTNNRGNGLYVWGGKNCTYPMKVVPGGVSEDSDNLNVNLKDYSVNGHGNVVKHTNVLSISPQ